MAQRDDVIGRWEPDEIARFLLDLVDDAAARVGQLHSPERLDDAAALLSAGGSSDEFVAALHVLRLAREVSVQITPPSDEVRWFEGRESLQRLLNDGPPES